MNWLYIFLLAQIVNHVSTLESNIPESNIGVSFEIPKPIKPMIFEQLDSSYKNPKKLKWQTEKSKKPTMVDIALEVAAREGINAMTNLYQNIEPQIVKNGQILEGNHPAALLSKFSAPVEGSERSAMAAFATLSATKAFRRNNKESAVLGRQAQSQKISFRRTPLEGLCPPRDPPTCMPASQRYRTHDGTCNNRRRLRWGSAQMPFNRFLPPEYGDGVDSIRGSVEGGALSSARFVSLLVHGAKEGDAPLTLMIVQWGQLLDHDMTSTAQPRSINGSVPSCCGSKDFHPLCFPIKVPLDDPWLAPLKVRCLEFLRSAPAQRRDCVLSWREQTNQVTSYIDASPIYSSNAKTSDNARIFRNGLLIYGRGDPADDVCMRGAIAHQCIRSGDGRSGEQPGLLALHHVWVGEHNRIAMELSILNPHWSDEKVYQETRRIIGALFQHITFREFLPIVLGREVCKLFDLELVQSGYYTGYDPNVNPTISNAFAAAAFRFGHSLVQNSYMRCDRNHNFINNNVTLHEEFHQGDIGTAGSLHRLLRGMAAQKALKRDEFITPELTNHLFQTPGFPFGLDLAAINIQRGRDHGIAPYTAWRQPCGLSPINTWEELSNVVGPESAKRISHAYRNVHDIDLFVGGIAERPVVGGLVGPTFACIIAQQFSNSRKGDRFWYENPGFESSFTPAQLNSLRHVSLSSVLCRAVNGGTLQPYVFLPNDVKGNERIKCGKDALEPIDLRPWLEQDPFLMSNEKIDNNISLQGTPTSTPSNGNKEEKGINNRIQNVTAVANVDFIPNSSIGFHRVANMTKIHDKLDMVQKLVARPIVKPIRGINNKLDKHRLSVKNSLKPTAASASKRISTTRRTVVIHNVQIELRSANGANKELINQSKKTDGQRNSLASTAQDTILKVAGVVKSQISAAMGFLSNKDEEASPKHLSRQMNDQSDAPNGVTNFTNLIHVTNNTFKSAASVSSSYKNLTTVRVSKNETNTESLLDEFARESFIEDRKEKLTGTNPTIEKNNEDLHQNDLTNTENTQKLNESNNESSKEHYQNDQYSQQQDFNINSPNTQKVSTKFHNIPKKLNETTKQLSNLYDITPDHTTETVINMTNEQGSTRNYTVHDANTEPDTNNSKTVFAEELSKQLINDEINKHYMITENTSHTISKHPETSNDDKQKTEFSEQHDPLKDFQAIINSALQDSLEQHKRVHRKTDVKNIQVKKVDFHTNLDFIDKLRTLRVDRNDDLAENPLTDPELNETPETDLTENYFTDSDDTQISTEQSPKLENIELRQFQERPIYKRPQKLILDAPKSDQYEIEINIRQTNTRPPQNVANYEDYNSPNKRYDNDRFNQQFDFNGNSPSNSFFTPTTRIPYGTRTKPPTIIYIDEHDERTTTRGTGIFQNILSFATNSLNSVRPQTTSTESPFNHKPNRIVNNGQNSSPESYLSSYPSRPYQHSKPSSSNYINAPQNQNYPPQSGFNQGPNNYIPPVVPPQSFPHQNIFPPQALPGANSFSTASNVGGVAHASSNAISTGHFGAIAGSASSSGGDSTFSFNIRPSPRPQLNLMSPESVKPNYELLPQRWPQLTSTPSYAVPPKPMPPVESFEYPPNKHDPFSSYTRKPPSYYNKFPNNVFDPAYDDIGRSELTIDDDGSKANQTKDNEDDDYDYNDDDEVDRLRHFLKNDNAVEEHRTSNKNDNIDYLRLAEQTLTNRTQLNETIVLDDNFVLPMLRQSDTFIEPREQEPTVTIPTKIGEQKSLGHDIFAEDYDELLTGRSSFLDSQASQVAGQWNKLKKSSQSVAFAPIQVLTRPERPDNWVIFDTVDEKPLLPVVQPDYNMETLAAAEVPMPIVKRKNSQTSTETLYDKNFSTEQTTTSTTEQTPNEFTTDNTIEELTTSLENLTDEPEKLDLTTEANESTTTEAENERLKGTEIALDQQTQNIDYETKTIQTIDSFTDIQTEAHEFTTSLDSLTDEPEDQNFTENKNIDNTEFIRDKEKENSIGATNTSETKSSMTDAQTLTEELTTLPNLT